MGGTCKALGKVRNMCRILGGKPEGKILFERSRSGWEDLYAQ
jgi:hypothetical protein